MKRFETTDRSEFIYSFTRDEIEKIKVECEAQNITVEKYLYDNVCVLDYEFTSLFQQSELSPEQGDDVFLPIDLQIHDHGENRVDLHVRFRFENFFSSFDKAMANSRITAAKKSKIGRDAKKAIEIVKNSDEGLEGSIIFCTDSVQQTMELCRALNASLTIFKIPDTFCCLTKVQIFNQYNFAKLLKQAEGLYKDIYLISTDTIKLFQETGLFLAHSDAFL